MLNKLFVLTLLGSAMTMLLAAYPAPTPAPASANLPAVTVILLSSPSEPTNVQIVPRSGTGTYTFLSQHRSPLLCSLILEIGC